MRRIPSALFSFAVAVVILAAVPARAAFVYGEHLGTKAGNDSVGQILSDFALDVTYLAKVDLPDPAGAGPYSNEGLKLFNFVFKEPGEVESGKWKYDGSLGTVLYLAVKGGNSYALYEFSLAALGADYDPNKGRFSNADLFPVGAGNLPGISHVTVYGGEQLSPVPLPTAGWLMISALMLLLGAAWRQQKDPAESR